MRGESGNEGANSSFSSSWISKRNVERDRTNGKSGLDRPAAKTCFASLESGGSVAGCGRRIVVGHYRKIRRIR